MFAENLFGNRNKAFKRIAISLALLLLIFFLVYHFINTYFLTIQTTDALQTTLNITESYSAYTFRDETVLYSQFGGAFDYHVRNGELVSPDTSLVDCYEKATEIDVSAKKEELLLEIDRLTKSNSNKKPTVSDINIAQSNARRTYMEMLKTATLGDMAKAQVYSEQMLIELNRLSVYSDSSGNFNDEIDVLKAELEALDSYFVGSYDDSVVNEKTGHYFYDVDGYESAFSSIVDGQNRAEKLTLSEFYSLVEKMPQVSPPSGKYYAGKIINDYKWFIGVPLTREQSSTFFTGKTYDVKYNDSGNTIPMVLSRIITGENDSRAVLIFEASDMPPGFTYPRSATITLQKKEYSGLRVPVELVVKVDGFNGVYTVEKLTVRFKKINIIYKEYGYYIVSEYDTSDTRYFDYLSHNDAIITRGKNIYDGKVVG